MDLYRKCVEQHKDTIRTWDFDLWQCTDDELVYLLLFMYEDRGNYLHMLMNDTVYRMFRSFPDTA
jgi:hypothetical protein